MADGPVMFVGLKERHVGLHQALTLECHVDARPRARLSWKHNGTDVFGRVNVIVGASVDYNCQKRRMA